MTDSKDAPTDLTASLLVRLRAGDPQAGALLDQLYRAPLTRFAWGYLGAPEEAEDAVQEVFTKVLSAERVPAAFRAWIYRVARNHCLNLLRARERRRDAQRLDSEVDAPAPASGHLSRLAREEEQADAAKLLAELPGEHGELLRLRYAEGLSREEIAEVLDLPASVVKSRLYEGVQKLRRRFGAS